MPREFPGSCANVNVTHRRTHSHAHTRAHTCPHLPGVDVVQHGTERGRVELRVRDGHDSRVLLPVLLSDLPEPSTPAHDKAGRHERNKTSVEEIYTWL